MPKIKSLLQVTSQTLRSDPSITTIYFTSIDLQYAQSQLKLHPDMARNCKFRLTDMPAEFRKLVDFTVIGLDNTFCYLDNILIVSKGTYDNYMTLVKNFPHGIVEENFRINLRKCHMLNQKKNKMFGS